MKVCAKNQQETYCKITKSSSLTTKPCAERCGTRAVLLLGWCIGPIEAMDLQKEYIQSFSQKYPIKVRSENFLQYERNGCGDGKSHIELKLDLIHKQQRLEREQR